MTRRWPISGFTLAILWLFVRGVELAVVPILEEFIIGLGVGMTVAFSLRRFYAPSTPVARNVRVAPYAVLYLVVFLKELATANVDVARRVLLPSMPINPTVVEVPLRVKTDAAITTIANSITLTPGTLTMDYDQKTNTLYVHSIDGTDRESIFDPIRTWEDYALVIFDEELKPGDPVPQLQTDGGVRDAGVTDGGTGEGPGETANEDEEVTDDGR